jgi:Uma2 family endonuclease
MIHTIATPEHADGRTRKRWTRDECRRIVEAGLIDGAAHELIGGDILVRPRQTEPHVYACHELFSALAGVFGVRFVRFRAPVALDDRNEPEADAAVTLRPDAEYLTRGTPTPADIRLAVEVSDTTLRFDTTAKALLYARAGIPEYWVLDLNGRRLLVHTDPGQSGYASVTTLGETDTVLPAGAPAAGAPVRVAALLP